MNSARNTLNQQRSTSSAGLEFPSLSVVLRIFCVLPFVTGVLDLFIGARIFALSGTEIPASVVTDPNLNNQIKFWGAIWFGYGLSLWWVSSDLRQRATLFRILMYTLLLSGLGRALSVYQYGPGSAFSTGAMLVELLGSVALLVWHGRLLGRADQASSSDR